MSSLAKYIAVPRYDLNVDQQLSRQNVVIEFRLPDGEPASKLKTIRRVLQEQGISWIRTMRVDGRTLLIYTKTRAAIYRQDRRRFYRRIRQQLDNHVVLSMQIHRQHDPSVEKITKSKIRKVTSRHSQTRRRPAPRRSVTPAFA